CGSDWLRRCIHSWSAHRYSDSVTTEAVAGGTSVARAIGSAFICQDPSENRISYLYFAPALTPGRNTSHTPVVPRDRIAAPRPSHPLKSPTTRTARAFGAQTAKEVPVTTPSGVG